MRSRKLWIQLLIFLTAFVAPALLMIAAWDLVLAGAAYALCGALGLWAGWTFLWGTIDQKRVAALFGSPDTLAQQIVLPDIPVPPPPPTSYAPEGVALTVIVPEAMRLPQFDLQPALENLPKSPPRLWRLREVGAASLVDYADYLALAGVDIAQELEHIEQLLTPTSPDGEVKLPHSGRE